MTKVHKFLELNNMLASSFNAEEVEREFLLDMQSKKSLCMFNTYITNVPKTWTDEKILAIDAGGTNLRFSMFENGTKISEEKMKMFGIEKEIPVEEFFDEMAKLISKYDCKKVGFCFSYPAEILPNNDAKIIIFNKEVKISGAEGKIIGEEINKRLKDKREFYLLNDTVACQLGVSADIGMILGTGFNLCYFDKIKGVIVNTEAGMFDGIKRGVFDKKLEDDLNSHIVQVQKMICGAYLGKLIEETAEGYFGKDIPQFELKDVSLFLIGEGILYSYFNDDEKVEFREIIDAILERAAKYVAIMIKCLAQDNKEVAIGIEGSTIYKLPGYYEKVVRAIEALPGIKFSFLDARDTISIGTARACIR